MPPASQRSYVAPVAASDAVKNPFLHLEDGDAIIFAVVTRGSDGMVHEIHSIYVN